MKKRVYGIIGIKSIMSNWNADFSGYPKSTSDGEVFGSDKALKYPMKKMWDDNGEKVLYIKSYKIDDDSKKKDEVKLRPRSLKERYEKIFEVSDLATEKDSRNVVKNLFLATDVKQFGATFAEAKNNISITGAVQINQGFNIYDGHSVEEQQILSPFRNPKDKKEKSNNKNQNSQQVEDEVKEQKSTTLGTKIVSSEAHYIYPFVVNPKAYNNYVEMKVTDGYTEEDYKKFKEAALISATAFNTNSKTGCENEISIFVETDEELYLPSLASFIEFRKENSKGIFTLKFKKLFESLDQRINNVEIYYNPYDTEFEYKIEGEKYKYFNIFTREEVK